uniref:Uncharacterized protein n=1 Tax=Kalanchoe fedtschenkoi TaxID=63787 RepID=A0A7N0TQ12_KALFE
MRRGVSCGLYCLFQIFLHGCCIKCEALLAATRSSNSARIPSSSWPLILLSMALASSGLFLSSMELGVSRRMEADTDVVAEAETAHGGNNAREADVGSHLPRISTRGCNHPPLFLSESLH